MAKARAIVKRLKAVKNIRKITRAMELIATWPFGLAPAPDLLESQRRASEVRVDVELLAMGQENELVVRIAPHGSG